MHHSNILAFTATLILGTTFPVLAAPPLAWERELPLREAAQTVFLKNTLNPTNPLPNWICYPSLQYVLGMTNDLYATTV